jgi:hypothetical protein
VPFWDSGRPRSLAVLGLDAAAFDFLLDYLPADDGFTKGLRELRDMARDELWARESG